MSVIQTDRWLSKNYDEPVKVCENLLPYFEDITPRELYDYLGSHGMYRPTKNGKETVTILQNKNIWKIVQLEWKILKRIWAGPDIPIFIFPSDENNVQIARDFNGKSGVAFKDKLFIFLPKNIGTNELKALLTHEYNHICVLAKEKRKEEEMTLLDSITIEGLAESAVKEQIGKEWTASWANYYTQEQLEGFYKKIISPHKNIKRIEREHNNILFGKGYYPKMVGYCVGYYLVQKAMQNKNITYKELFNMSLEDIKLAITI
ncbi:MULTISPECIES: DUF2268 domain-containing protein [Bacillus]|uniref:DUF2268 domain-containing protein n=1 Tax=Bacillus TaxID=1386 RepID=UPI000BB8C9FE|nr:MULTISPECIES: DUF2268 domain-containing protein [Bacillus]